MSPNARRPQHEAGGGRKDLAGSGRSLRLGCPCGCEAGYGEQCRYAEPWALREPVPRPRCPRHGHYCGALGVPEREALGREGLCCADVLAAVGGAA